MEESRFTKVDAEPEHDGYIYYLLKYLLHSILYETQNWIKHTLGIFNNKCLYTTEIIWRHASL